MYKIYSNSELYFGRESRKSIPEILEQHNVKNIFIIIGKNAVKHGIADKIYPLIDENKYRYITFNNIKPNPSIDNVLEGLEMTKEFKPDIILAVGGGSVIDTAKGISLAITNPDKENDVRKFAGSNATNNRCVPIIAVPTTCGTGTEVTQYFIISDEENQVKMVCADINSFPIIAVVDSELMEGMPKSLAATTGMDALTHAIEAYVSNVHNPISDMFALKAIANIMNNAYSAVIEENLESRENMALAQYMAGYAFANSGLGLVHAMAHQLGAVYDLPHGLCNAIILPYVVKYNGKEAGDRFKNIVEYLGVDTSEMTTNEAVDLLVKKINSLNGLIGVTEKLSERGVKEQDLEMLANKALQDPCCNANPIKPTFDDVLEIYKEAL